MRGRGEKLYLGAPRAGDDGRVGRARAGDDGRAGGGAPWRSRLGRKHDADGGGEPEAEPWEEEEPSGGGGAGGRTRPAGQKVGGGREGVCCRLGRSCFPFRSSGGK